MCRAKAAGESGGITGGRAGRSRPQSVWSYHQSAWVSYHERGPGISAQVGVSAMGEEEAGHVPVAPEGRYVQG